MTVLLRALAFALGMLMVIPPISGSDGAVAEELAQPPTDLLTPSLATRFLKSSQNVDGNRLASVSDLYFLVGILDVAGELGSLGADERGWLVDRLQSLQNSDGGFGDWYRDRSDVASTSMAVRALQSLGAAPLNSTGVLEYIDRLQVSGLLYGNFGFRETVKEKEADVASTYDAVAVVSALGGMLPNRTGVVAYLRNHQNYDGGFGYKTNRDSGVFWDSTTVYTNRGVLGLSVLGEGPDLRDRAVSFLKGMQYTSAGFSNLPKNDPSIAYTYNAVLALVALGEPVPRQPEVAAFVLANQMPNGGFLDHAVDTKEGIHTAFYAMRVLEVLGAQYDSSKVAAFARSFLDDRLDGGFGDYPGLGSTTMFTFDAVSALNLAGSRPTDVAGAIAFLGAGRNADGGFGEGNVSDVETTYRAMLAMRLLGAPTEQAHATIALLQSVQNPDGGFGVARGYVSRASYTYRAVRALAILGAAPIDHAGAVAYLRSLQNPDGGFGSSVGDLRSDMGSTYRAVRALATLGASPSDPGAAAGFIALSQNPDGGYRRSPSDTTAPDNASTSTFTYDAVLALDFLGTGVQDPASVYSFIDGLRNPDLGFGDQAQLPSTVSSTFSALWSLFYLYPSSLDSPPQLQNASYELQRAGTERPVTFGVTVSDPDAQAPEWVFAVVDGDRHLMSVVTSTPGAYRLDLEVPPGAHRLHFEAFDGVMTNRTADDTFEVVRDGQTPVVDLRVDPGEGLEDTPFKFDVSVSDPDGERPLWAMMRLDDGPWQPMASSPTGGFSCSTTLMPGAHQVWAKASDGVHVGYSAMVRGPLVFRRDASSPDWDTYLAVRALVQRERGLALNYSDIGRAIVDGVLAWRLSLPGGEVAYASNDGSRLFGPDADDGAPPPSGALPTALLAAAVAVAVTVVVIAALLAGGRRRRRRGRAVTGGGR